MPRQVYLLWKFCCYGDMFKLKKNFIERSVSLVGSCLKLYIHSSVTNLKFLVSSPELFLMSQYDYKN